MAGLSGAVPRAGNTALESRLIALESRVSQGPSGTVRMPFQVVNAAGKVVFSVADRDVPGAVNIRSYAGFPGPVMQLRSDAGKIVVSLGVNQEGNGRVATMDNNERVAGLLGEHGVVVFNTEGKQVAGITRGAGMGRVAVWHDGTLSVELTATSAGHGRVKSFDASGKLRAAMYGDMGVGVFDDAENNVAVMLHRKGAGVIGVSRTTADKLVAELSADSAGGSQLLLKASNGMPSIGLLGGQRAIVVANAQGKTVADMTVSPGGTGLFQVWSGERLPVALLGKAVERPGGILQLSNGKSVTSSLTVNSGGDGYWQLNNAGGTPMVEAGITTSGKGTVKAGPNSLCMPQQTSIVNRLPDCILGRSQ